MATAKDMAGMRFTRLLVLERGPKAPDGTLRWRCRCDCGAIRVVKGNNLRLGRTRSCGCASRDRLLALVTKHGKCGTTEYELWKHAKRRSRSLGLPFNLEVADIQIPERCPIFGLKLAPNLRVMGNNSPTLDRIVPALGYVRGNVAVISMKANRIKGDCTPEQLVALAEYVVAGRGMRLEGGREAASGIAL